MSDHWYKRDGTPCHYVEKKKGGKRATTLKDARKLDLLPSVSGIINMAAAPALDMWKQNQILEAAYRNSRAAVLHTDREWFSLLRKEAGEKGEEARDKGAEIHDYMESYFRGEWVPEPWASTARAIQERLQEFYCNDINKWQMEMPFGSDMGFGGTIDLKCPSVVVDFKTKDFSLEDKDPIGYDNQGMQLAAYRYGIGDEDAVCLNIFISRSHPGHFTFYEWKEKDIKRCWEMFQCLLGYWRLSKRYEP